MTESIDDQRHALVDQMVAEDKTYKQISDELIRRGWGGYQNCMIAKTIKQIAPHMLRDRNNLVDRLIRDDFVAADIVKGVEELGMAVPLSYVQSRMRQVKRKGAAPTRRKAQPKTSLALPHDIFVEPPTHVHDTRTSAIAEIRHKIVDAMRAAKASRLVVYANGQIDVEFTDVVTIPGAGRWNG